MTSYESAIHQIDAPTSKVFDTLSNMQNAQSLVSKLPENEKLQIEVLDNDTLTIALPGMGKMQLKVVERMPNNRIRLETVNFPIKAESIIDLSENGEHSTLKMTMNAELNMFIRNMVGNKIKDVVEMMAKLLSNIPYNAI